MSSALCATETVWRTSTRNSALMHWISYKKLLEDILSASFEAHK